MYLGVDWSDAEGGQTFFEGVQVPCRGKSAGNGFQIFTNAGKKLYF